MNSIRKQLLTYLLASREHFLSGEELSEKLHVSRTAIWKHIEELRKDGYQIDAVRKQGYKLISIPDLLTNSTIQPFLKTAYFGQKIYVYDQVESTQAVAHQLARDGAPHGTLVIAEHQTEGKGRLGRKWFSPQGTGVWMSLILRPDILLSSAPQLTLVSAVALVQGLNNYLEHVEIKWPNDLLINNKKVAGILTELQSETDRINHVIIGVGINVNQDANHFPEELKEIATSLRLELGSSISRQQLILDLIHSWEKLYLIFEKHGFEPIKPLWESYSMSLGKRITARTIQGAIHGYAEGITDEGFLLIKDEQGKLHKIYSADIETT